MSIFYNSSNVSLKYCYLDMLPNGSYPLPNPLPDNYPTEAIGNGYTYELCKEQYFEGYRQYNNTWTKVAFPEQTVVVGTGKGFQPKYGNSEAHNFKLFSIDYNKVGTDEVPRKCKIVTKPFFFESIANVKEITALRLAVDGSGLMPTLYVDRQKNLFSEKLRVKIDPWVDRDGYVIYYLREAGEYKYLTFTLEWTNTDNNYIHKLYALSLITKVRGGKTR